MLADFRGRGLTAGCSSSTIDLRDLVHWVTVGVKTALTFLRFVEGREGEESTTS
jgi:hypothetical protein